MKLVVCIDGTWNEASTRTNVWKLKQDLGCSGDTQATYIEGIGTVTGDELLGGMFAADFDRPLGLAYRWLTKKILNAPKDEDIALYLFGFSRGGYLAHTLSWLLHEVGVPRKFADAIPIAEAYAKKDAKAVERLKSEGVLPSPKIGMLGLWDALLLFNSGKGIEVVDPVGDFYQKSLAGHLALQLGVRKKILLRLSWGAIGAVEVFVAQGGNRIYDVPDD